MSDIDDTPKPPLSQRDLSYNVALAGAAAKDEAAELGGDPAQLAGLIAAAQAQSPCITPGARGLKGFPLRHADVLVTICLNLYQIVFGADATHQLSGQRIVEETDTAGKTIQAMFPMPPGPETEVAKMEALAALALIFTQAEDAYELLRLAVDSGSDETQRADVKRDFLRTALDFAGAFTQAETEILIAHITQLIRRSTASEPGKQTSPAS